MSLFDGQARLQPTKGASPVISQAKTGFNPNESEWKDLDAYLATMKSYAPMRELLFGLHEAFAREVKERDSFERLKKRLGNYTPSIETHPSLAQSQCLLECAMQEIGELMAILTDERRLLAHLSSFLDTFPLRFFVAVVLDRLDAMPNETSKAFALDCAITVASSLTRLAHAYRFSDVFYESALESWRAHSAPQFVKNILPDIKPFYLPVRDIKVIRYEKLSVLVNNIMHSSFTCYYYQEYCKKNSPDKVSFEGIFAKKWGFDEFVVPEKEGLMLDTSDTIYRALIIAYEQWDDWDVILGQFKSMHPLAFCILLDYYFSEFFMHDLERKNVRLKDIHKAATQQRKSGLLSVNKCGFRVGFTHQVRPSLRDRKFQKEKNKIDRIYGSIRANAARINANLTRAMKDVLSKMISNGYIRYTILKYLSLDLRYRLKEFVDRATEDEKLAPVLRQMIVSYPQKSKPLYTYVAELLTIRYNLKDMIRSSALTAQFLNDLPTNIGYSLCFMLLKELPSYADMFNKLSELERLYHARKEPRRELVLDRIPSLDFDIYTYELATEIEKFEAGNTYRTLWIQFHRRKIVASGFPQFVENENHVAYLLTLAPQCTPIAFSQFPPDKKDNPEYRRRVHFDRRAIYATKLNIKFIAAYMKLQPPIENTRILSLFKQYPTDFTLKVLLTDRLESTRPVVNIVREVCEGLLTFFDTNEGEMFRYLAFTVTDMKEAILKFSENHTDARHTEFHSMVNRLKRAIPTIKKYPRPPEFAYKKKHIDWRDQFHFAGSTSATLPDTPSVPVSTSATPSNVSSGKTSTSDASPAVSSTRLSTSEILPTTPSVQVSTSAAPSNVSGQVSASTTPPTTSSVQVLNSGTPSNVSRQSSTSASPPSTSSVEVSTSDVPSSVSRQSSTSTPPPTTPSVEISTSNVPSSVSRQSSTSTPPLATSSVEVSTSDALSSVSSQSSTSTSPPATSSVEVSTFVAPSNVSPQSSTSETSPTMSSDQVSTSEAPLDVLGQVSTSTTPSTTSSVQVSTSGAPSDVSRQSATSETPPTTSGVQVSTSETPPTMSGVQVSTSDTPSNISDARFFAFDIPTDVSRTQMSTPGTTPATWSPPIAILRSTSDPVPTSPVLSNSSPDVLKEIPKIDSAAASKTNDAASPPTPPPSISPPILEKVPQVVPGAKLPNAVPQPATLRVPVDFKIVPTGVIKNGEALSKMAPIVQAEASSSGPPSTSWETPFEYATSTGIPQYGRSTQYTTKQQVVDRSEVEIGATEPNFGPTFNPGNTGVSSNLQTTTSVPKPEKKTSAPEESTQAAKASTSNKVEGEKKLKISSPQEEAKTFKEMILSQFTPQNKVLGLIQNFYDSMNVIPPTKTTPRDATKEIEYYQACAFAYAARMFWEYCESYCPIEYIPKMQPLSIKQINVVPRVQEDVDSAREMLVLMYNTFAFNDRKDAAFEELFQKASAKVRRFINDTLKKIRHEIPAQSLISTANKVLISRPLDATYPALPTFVYNPEVLLNAPAAFKPRPGQKEKNRFPQENQIIKIWGNHKVEPPPFSRQSGPGSADSFFDWPDATEEFEAYSVDDESRPDPFVNVSGTQSKGDTLSIRQDASDEPTSRKKSSSSTIPSATTNNRGFRDKSNEFDDSLSLPYSTSFDFEGNADDAFESSASSLPPVSSIIEPNRGSSFVAPSRSTSPLPPSDSNKIDTDAEQRFSFDSFDSFDSIPPPPVPEKSAVEGEQSLFFGTSDSFESPASLSKSEKPPVEQEQSFPLDNLKEFASIAPPPNPEKPPAEQERSFLFDNPEVASIAPPSAPETPVVDSTQSFAFDNPEVASTAPPSVPETPVVDSTQSFAFNNPEVAPTAPPSAPEGPVVNLNQSFAFDNPEVASTSSPSSSASLDVESNTDELSNESSDARTQEDQSSSPRSESNEPNSLDAFYNGDLAKESSPPDSLNPQADKRDSSDTSKEQDVQSESQSSSNTERDGFEPSEGSIETKEQTPSSRSTSYDPTESNSFDRSDMVESATTSSSSRNLDARQDKAATKNSSAMGDGGKTSRSRSRGKVRDRNPSNASGGAASSVPTNTLPANDRIQIGTLTRVNRATAATGKTKVPISMTFGDSIPPPNLLLPQPLRYEPAIVQPKVPVAPPPFVPSPNPETQDLKVSPPPAKDFQSSPQATLLQAAAISTPISSPPPIVTDQAHNETTATPSPPPSVAIRTERPVAATVSPTSNLLSQAQKPPPTVVSLPSDSVIQSQKATPTSSSPPVSVVVRTQSPTTPTPSPPPAGIVIRPQLPATATLSSLSPDATVQTQLPTTKTPSSHRPNTIIRTQLATTTTPSNAPIQPRWTTTDTQVSKAPLFDQRFDFTPLTPQAAFDTRRSTLPMSTQGSNTSTIETVKPPPNPNDSSTLRSGWSMLSRLTGAISSLFSSQTEEAAPSPQSPAPEQAPTDTKVLPSEQAPTDTKALAPQQPSTDTKVLAPEPTQKPSYEEPPFVPPSYTLPPRRLSRVDHQSPSDRMGRGEYRDASVLQCVDLEVKFDAKFFTYDSRVDSTLYAKPQTFASREALRLYLVASRKSLDDVRKDAMQKLYANMYPDVFPVPKRPKLRKDEVDYAFWGELAVKREAIIERNPDQYRSALLSPKQIYQMATYRGITCNVKAYETMQTLKDKGIFVKELKLDYGRMEYMNWLHVAYYLEKTTVYLGPICVFVHAVTQRNAFNVEHVTKEIDFILRLCQWEPSENPKAYRVRSPHQGATKRDLNYKILYSSFNRPTKISSNKTWVNDKHLSLHSFDLPEAREDVLHRLLYGNATVSSPQPTVAKRILPHFSIDTKSTLGLQLARDSTGSKPFQIKLEASETDQQFKRLNLMDVNLRIFIGNDFISRPPLELRTLLHLLIPQKDFVYKESYPKPYYYVKYRFTTNHVWLVLENSDTGEKTNRKFLLLKNLFLHIPHARLEAILDFILFNYDS